MQIEVYDIAAVPRTANLRLSESCAGKESDSLVEDTVDVLEREAIDIGVL
jgi:hypothetical protein